MRAFLDRHRALFRGKLDMAVGASGLAYRVRSVQQDVSNASHTAEVSATQLRLLLLLDALHDEFPEVLSLTLYAPRWRPGGGLPSADDISPTTHLGVLDSLVAFATHVPDSSWVAEPASWTFPPVMKPRDTDAKLVRSLLLHVVGKEYKLPPALKECKLTKWERRNMGSSLRGHFLRIAVAVARGASRRDELRAAFPTLQLSREAVHAFARMPRRARVPSGCDTYALYATPFGVLRAAQLMALGFDMQTAFLTLPSLLPPEPCADAGEEKLLLASARFLLQHGAFREARDCMDDVAARGIPHNAYDDIYSEQFAAQLQDAGYPIARAYDEADSLQPLADIGFLLHTRARAAEAAHTPQRDAFSFRGRTLASLLHLAMQHRRDAVLASAVVNGGRPRQDPPLWRLPLAWDADCEAMLAPHIDAVFRERSSLPSREWAGSLRTDVPGMSRLRGRWHMRELHRQRDVLLEGKQQHNCLSYRKHIWEHEMYWSLRFTPDADAVLALDGSTRTEVERVVAAERHTVCLQGARVTGLAGPCNAAPTRAAARALARWAPTGVDLGRFGGARRRPGRQR